MSSIDTVVFRTTDRRVLDEISAYEKEHKAWRRRLKKLVKELDPSGVRQPIVSSGGFSSTDTFIGLSLISADYRSNPANPGSPLGWRTDKKRGVLLPHRSKPEGKAIAKKIDGCQPPTHTRVNRATSEDEGLAVVGLEAEALEGKRRNEGRRSSGGKSPRLVILDACAAITALKPVDVADACANDDQAAYLARRILEAASVIREIRALL